MVKAVNAIAGKDNTKYYTKKYLPIKNDKDNNLSIVFIIS